MQDPKFKYESRKKYERGNEMEKRRNKQVSCYDLTPIRDHSEQFQIHKITGARIHVLDNSKERTQKP